MKTEEELRPIMEKIASENSPVGMNALYVHAVILDKLISIENRLTQLEKSQSANDPVNKID